jgi:AcrR family transcriptional regulator
MAKEFEAVGESGGALQPSELRRPSTGRDANASAQKIVLGAIETLARRGSRSLSMSDVAEAANVSRATLYRYFPTKESVLEAVSEYISDSFIRGAEQIARAAKSPTEKLQAIMSLQFNLATEAFITRITEVEPGLVLKFLADHYDRHVSAIRKVLDPLYDAIEASAGVEVDRDVLSASVLRMQLSLVIVPPDERWRTSPQVLTDMLSALMGALAPPARKPAGRRGAR